MSTTFTPLELSDADPRSVVCACCGGAGSLWEADHDGTVLAAVQAYRFVKEAK